MSKTFELNLPGLNELMKSAEMCAIINAGAGKIAANAISLADDDGFSIEAAHPISYVAIASVRTTTEKAYRAAMEDNVLEIAAGGASI